MSAEIRYNLDKNLSQKHIKTYFFPLLPKPEKFGIIYTSAIKNISTTI